MNRPLRITTAPSRREDVAAHSKRVSRQRLGWSHLRIIILPLVFLVLPTLTWSATYTVTNTNNSGAGSVRQAILDANGTAQPDTIIFNIPTTDPGWSGSFFTILLNSALPAITGPTTLDGASQTAFTGDTNPPVAEVTTGPEIIIDLDANTGPVLEVTGNNVTIDSVGVTNADGSINAGGGIHVDGADQTDILNCTVWKNATDGISLDNGTTNALVRDNVSTENGQVDKIRDGLVIVSSSNVTVEGNQFVKNAGFGIDLRWGTTNVTIEDNLSKENGQGGTDQLAGIGLHDILLGTGGSNVAIRNNTITKNKGDGVIVNDAWTLVQISQNSISENDDLGIDLGAGGDLAGDGVTANDGGDPDTGVMTSRTFQPSPVS